LSRSSPLTSNRSGRRGYSSAPMCESTHSIDLAWPRRRGMLEPRRYSLAWGRALWLDQHCCSGGWSASSLLGHGFKRVNELVPFRYTATMFGGRRQWFMCLKCGRRCRRIFGGRHFGCVVNAMVLCTPLRVSRHTNAPSTGPIALGSVWVVVGALSMAKTSHRNRRACAGGPIGASNGTMSSCRAGGWPASRGDWQAFSSAYDEGVSGK
jgi:hypothetical protein